MHDNKKDQVSIHFVASRLRALRTQHNLTQQELAELAGTSEKFLQQIESCRKKQIWLSTVGAFAEALGLKVDEFLAQDLPEKKNLPRRIASSRVHNIKKP